MPSYIRMQQEGGTFFFTVVTHKRALFLTLPVARQCLHEAWQETQKRYPFETLAVCLLPDHLHTVWTLPEGDTDYSSRWRFLKARFSWRYRKQEGIEESVSKSRRKKDECGFWQRRFWEHTIRNDEDLRRHFDYIHYNPVKHGLTESPGKWEWSTFHKYVQMGWYEAEWGSSPVNNIIDMDCE